MIQLNNQRIADEKIKNKVGGVANESRFYTTEKELRTPKTCIIPAVGSGGYVKLQQAWNGRSKDEDVVRITVKFRPGMNYLVVTRGELEQAVAAMAQGMETIKWCEPRIKKMGEN